jgi:shikimate dehydrogenase
MSPEIFYGIIGCPVKHSLSPLMQNAAFKALGISAEYKLFPLEEKGLEQFLKGLARENILGLNVTVPYKEKVIPFLNSVSGQARLIGAVNTIKVGDSRLEGFNTDAEGFLRHLTQDLKFLPRGRNIAILGAGGAARAVAVSLSAEAPKSIAIYDIKKNKAQDLTAHLKENFKRIDYILAASPEGLKIELCDLLVNATPLGMKENDPLPIGEKFLHAKLLVYDLVYNPAQTQLLKLAKGKGAAISNGLGMLLYQGARSFEIWTGKEAPLEVMRNALNEGVKKI